jgi:hypothetical protein
VNLVGFNWKNKAPSSAQIRTVCEIFSLVFERLHKLMGKSWPPQKLEARHCKLRIKEFSFPAHLKKIMEFAIYFAIKFVYVLHSFSFVPSSP